LRRLSPLLKASATLLYSTAVFADPLARLLLPVLEPVYLKLKTHLEPKFENSAQQFVAAIIQADPADLSE
jgi:hypothetical protein